MMLAKIAIVLLQASVFLIVLSLGLQSTWQEATSLFRRPAMLARSLLSMNIVMPIFAAVVAGVFKLNSAVELALVLLAVSPVPPLLPQRQLKLGGSRAYVQGLLTAMSLLSIVVVPITIEVLGKIFGHDVHVGPAMVARIVGRTILLPLGLGILVHLRASAFAESSSILLARIGNALLIVTLLPLLLFAGRLIMGLVGNGTVLAMAAFAVVAVAVGHWLGRPDPAERSTLALATAFRHPGLAMAIAAANFPGQRMLVAAAILLYLLVSTIVLLPYTAWCKRRVARQAEAAGPQQRAA